jgi:hypothetical protein
MTTLEYVGIAVAAVFLLGKRGAPRPNSTTKNVGTNTAAPGSNTGTPGYNPNLPPSQNSAGGGGLLAGLGSIGGAIAGAFKGYSSDTGNNYIDPAGNPSSDIGNGAPADSGSYTYGDGTQTNTTYGNPNDPNAYVSDSANYGPFTPDG